MKPIVVVDAKELTYARYVGKICSHKFGVAEEFSQQWIEELREDPVSFQDKFQIEDQSAPAPGRSPETA